MEGLFKAFDDICAGLCEIFAKPMGSYCRLETSDHSHIIAAEDGSMVTLIDLRGSLKRILYGSDEFRLLSDKLNNSLAPKLTHPGHSVQFCFEYDPEGVADELTAALQPIRNTTRNLQLDMETLLDDHQRAVAKWTASERCWLALWTRPSILPKAEMRSARKEMARLLKDSPPVGRVGQRVTKIMHGLQNEHWSFVMSVLDAFKQVDVFAKALEVHDALWWVRHSVDPHYTSRKWRPLLPGDPFPRVYRTTGDPNHHGYFLYPSLKRQLFPREGETLDRRTIRIGDRIHHPVIMSLPPQHPSSFQKLFSALKNKRMPWRGSFLLDADGLSCTTFRKALTGIIAFASSTNKQFNKAVEQLREQAMNDKACIVKFQACFDTWADGVDEKAREEARKRASELASTVQSWGVCDTEEVTGDPLLGVMGAIPAAMPTSPAPAAAAPLSEIMGMLPLTRPASPWSNGSALFRTPDGKLMPFTPMSSQQSAWIDIGMAPMGAGKSVHLNTMNLSFALQPGLKELPFCSIIDIGVSSSGLIKLIQNALPKSKRHLAAYHRLRMVPEHSINPFDTPLGCRTPLPIHESFLVNLCCLFCTPHDKSSTPDGVSGLARMAIVQAYKECSPDRSPKPYTKGLDEVVDEAVDHLGVTIDENSTWWEIVDDLFAKGYPHEAMLAQRYAVPLLSDVAAVAQNHEGCKKQYDFTVGSTSEPVTDFFYRCLSDAMVEYTILRQPTAFDIGDARIVSLDLDEVAPRGGAQADRHCAVMYMLARHVLGAKFFWQEEDVKLMPEQYRRHNGAIIKLLRQSPKRLCYDEFHRVSTIKAIADQVVNELTTTSRESRKWNLSIGLYSQDIGDFPPILVELATAIFILGAGTEQSATKLSDMMGLNEACRYTLPRLRKPTAQGADFIAIFKTGKGVCHQVLTNTLGPQQIWAFSTTSEDRAVRDEMYKRIGVPETLARLALRHPEGLKAEVEMRRQNVEQAQYGEGADVIADLIEELCVGPSMTSCETPAHEEPQAA